MSTAGTRREIAPTDYNFRFRDCFLGAQMLFVAFGALVLVPILTGLDSNVALFTAGIGTLLFQICTRGKVPIFLASSFAFIAPIIYGVQTWGVAQTLGGLVCSGAVYFLLSCLIRWRGTDVVMRVLPPIVTGPVIMVIGLILAPVAVNMALGKTGDGSASLVPENTALWISMMQCLLDICGDLYRYGGEEFAVVLPDYDAFNAHAVGDRLRAAVAALDIPHESNNGGIVTISVGVATIQDDLASHSTVAIAERLVAEADKVLYMAKSSGRNTVRSVSA